MIECAAPTPIRDSQFFSGFDGDGAGSLPLGSYKEGTKMAHTVTRLIFQIKNLRAEYVTYGMLANQGTAMSFAFKTTVTRPWKGPACAQWRRPWRVGL
jgi:hypothetical protein